MHEIIKRDLEEVKNRLIKFENKIKNKTFLVTGGSGFIGSWFCDVLDGFGAKIICVDNLSSGSVDNIKHLIGKSNFEFHEIDILNYKNNIKLDYIIHMASIATPGIYQKYPIETLDTNLIGTREMLKLAEKNNVKGFLLTSTSEVYGNPTDDNIPTSEDYYGYVNSYGPRAMYDEAKRGAEAYCYSFFLKNQNLPIRIVRIFNTYGPKLDIKSTSQYGRALVKFIWQALHDEPITIYSDGKQSRAFCYIIDQLEGLFNLLLTDGLNGQVINIGSNKEYSILELAEKIIKITNSKSKLAHGSPPNYDLKDDPRRRCANSSKAKDKLGWNITVDLDEGLKRTSEWLKSQI